MRHRICAFPQRGWQQKQGHPRHGRRTIPAHGSTFVRQYNHSAGRCAAHPHKITFGNPRLHGHHHLCCTGSPACRPVNYFGWMRMQLLPPPTEISPAPQGLWWTRPSLSLPLSHTPPIAPNCFHRLARAQLPALGAPLRCSTPCKESGRTTSRLWSLRPGILGMHSMATGKKTYVNSFVNGFGEGVRGVVSKE
jgi:hypothetical protein